ncbi:MAG: Crp/Fnr family transcriptional regulator [Erysipelotrichaceae bacterium]|nr:Crp/Fnr family transcriptional regulator [Erysipelotrichaceae bacterium]
MEQITHYLQQLPFFTYLTQEEQQQLANISYLASFQKGQIIHDQGSDCLGMIMVLDGELRTFMLSDEGREITLYRLEKDDVDILSASCVVNQITFDTQMVAVRDCTLLVIPAVHLSQWKEKNIYIRSFIYELATDRFSDVMWMIQQTLFLRVDQRIAIYLLDAYHKTKNPEIKTTQEEIALEINSAREVVARMVKNMVKEGWLQTKRGTFIIQDAHALQTIIQ